jgi:hypothetical protein
MRTANPANADEREKKRKVSGWAVANSGIRVAKRKNLPPISPGAEFCLLVRNTTNQALQLRTRTQGDFLGSTLVAVISSMDVMPCCHAGSRSRGTYSMPGRGGTGGEPGLRRTSQAFARRSTILVPDSSARFPTPDGRQQCDGQRRAGEQSRERHVRFSIGWFIIITPHPRHSDSFCYLFAFGIERAAKGLFSFIRSALVRKVKERLPCTLQLVLLCVS